MNELLTWLPETAAAIPAEMPSPFADTPHPLAVQAAAELQQRLSKMHAWPGNYSPERQGKMFGVLVVLTGDNRLAYLSAFSAMIGGSWQMPGFVPQLFDLARHEHDLSQGNRELARLADQQAVLEQAPELHELRHAIHQLQEQRDSALDMLKQQHASAKAERRAQRATLAAAKNAETNSEMIRQQLAALALASQRHKREALNAREAWQQRLAPLQQRLLHTETAIEELKQTRSALSRQLHRQFFDCYRLRNRLGEEQPITHFFKDGTPPAGAGDCAGPKLIHFALAHDLQPVALAEFWWGAQPSSGIRHHAHFYPACRGKCHPILPFMLRGMPVEKDPDYQQAIAADEPHMVYEDEQLLLVYKPAGLMSAPGKHVHDSALARLRKRYPQFPGLTLVHRLDMATSGLLLLATNARSNKRLQQQFINHTVEKRYEALLSKPLPAGITEGVIDLPLRIDLDDRPRQMVCYDYGKAATTRWQRLGCEGDTTRIHFWPLTGRTHQLRMHAAHRDGLNAAIVGDALYGDAAERLMLHAGFLSFTHPTNGKRMRFEIPAPF